MRTSMESGGSRGITLDESDLELATESEIIGEKTDCCHEAQVAGPCVRTPHVWHLGGLQGHAMHKCSNHCSLLPRHTCASQSELSGNPASEKTTSSGSAPDGKITAPSSPSEKE